MGKGSAASAQVVPAADSPQSYRSSSPSKSTTTNRTKNSHVASVLHAIAKADEGLVERQGLSPEEQLFVPPTCPFWQVGVEVDLEFRVGRHDSADVPTVHDHTTGSTKIALQAQQRGSYVG